MQTGIQRNRLHMLDLSLFLGFCVDSPLSDAIDLVDPGVVALFIGSGDAHYLQETMYEGKRYIGKFLGSITDTSTLSLVESNIYSLMKRIVPTYPSGELPLYLISVEI